MFRCGSLEKVSLFEKCLFSYLVTYSLASDIYVNIMARHQQRQATETKTTMRMNYYFHIFYYLYYLNVGKKSIAKSTSFVGRKKLQRKSLLSNFCSPFKKAFHEIIKHEKMFIIRFYQKALIIPLPVT